MAKYTLKVTTQGSNLNVRSSPSDNSKIIGKLANGTIVTSSKLSGNWYYIDEKKGYSYSGYLKVQKEEKKTQNTSDNNTKLLGSNTGKIPTKPKYEFTKLDSNYVAVDSALAQKVLVNNVSGIIGLPYQFSAIVDPRLMVDNKNKAKFGRKYSEKILSRMPLVFIQPCKPAFLKGMNKKTKKNVVQSLIDIGLSNKKGEVESYLNNIYNSKKANRYYTTEFCYAEYYKYVNSMCQTCASLLGLQNTYVKLGKYRQTLGKFRWEKALSNDFKSYFSAKETIPIYVDSVTSVSESFSNSTTESSLASSFDNISSMAREVQFLLGSEAGVTIDALSKDKYDTTASSINTIADKYLNGSSFIKNLGAQFTTVATGAQLVFPEIWADSDFSREYEINVKLRSPDCDTLSLYLNIIVPYIHLLCLAAPRVVSNSNPNGYKSPFLVRMYYKGLYNVDMGIVTSMSVTKGKEASWNADNIPAEMDISMNIKDLYSSLSIANYSNSSIKKFMNNTSLMDYLCNLCGITISQPEIQRTIRVWGTLVKSKWTGGFNNIWTTIENDISNLALGTFKNLLI